MDKLDLVVSKIDDLKQELTRGIDHLQDDVNDIKAGMNEIEIDLRKNADDIRYHIKRTDLTDKNIDVNESRLKRLEDMLSSTHLLKIMMSAVIGVGSIAGAIYGVIRLVDYFV